MRELREKLAARLVAVLHRELPNLYAIVPAEPQARSVQVVVDECVRQMEWARRKCWQPHATEYMPPRHLTSGEFSDAHGVRVAGMAELTLAPDDWRPE